jgi:hypothetical protein
MLSIQVQLYLNTYYHGKGSDIEKDFDKMRRQKFSDVNTMNAQRHYGAMLGPFGILGVLFDSCREAVPRAYPKAAENVPEI